MIDQSTCTAQLVELLGEGLDDGVIIDGGMRGRTPQPGSPIVLVSFSTLAIGANVAGGMTYTFRLLLATARTLDLEAESDLEAHLTNVVQLVLGSGWISGLRGSRVTYVDVEDDPGSVGYPAVELFIDLEAKP